MTIYDTDIYYVLCRHILECNLLTTILRPNFEDPLDTARYLVERNITLFSFPGTQIYKKLMIDSNIFDYKVLGENMIIPNSKAKYWDLSINHALRNGTHAVLSPGLLNLELHLGNWKKNNKTKGWWRSEEKLSGYNPFGGYLTHKKWHMNEVKWNYVDF